MATGYYHKHNMLKFRILTALMVGRRAMTAKEIAEAAGIEQKKVCDELYHWKKENNFHYVRRLKKKDGRFYRYTITKFGIRIYLLLRHRMNVGEKLGTKFSLNLCRRVKRLGDGELYYGINRKGVEMGLIREDLLPEEVEVE
jgi:transcription initiation factor IIE alpha subunit